MRWTLSARSSRPRARASTGGRARAALEDLLAELIIEVRAHDEDLKAFKLIDRPIHAGYQQLRTTVNSGGGGKKEEAKAGVAAGA